MVERIEGIDNIAPISCPSPCRQAVNVAWSRAGGRAGEGWGEGYLGTERVEVATPYRSFDELKSREVEEKDYRVRFHLRDERVLVMAPHGGKIEPTTSMIAEAIAGENYSLYSFEGLKEEGNDVLHIESHLFDEPRALQAVERADVVVTVHGQLNHQEGFTMVGGLQVDLRSEIRRRLETAGFQTRTPPEGLQGIDPENICNRGRLKAGVQLEVSRKERDLLKSDKERLKRFADAVRQPIQRFLRK